MNYVVRKFLLDFEKAELDAPLKGGVVMVDYRWFLFRRCGYCRR